MRSWIIALLFGLAALTTSRAGGATGYDQAVVEAFVADCAKEAGRQVCTCLIDRYQTEVPWEEFVRFSARMNANSPSEYDVRKLAEFSRHCYDTVGLPDAGYTKSIVAGFIDQCTASAGPAKRANCTCMIERFKAEVPWPRLNDVLKRVEAGTRRKIAT